MMLAPRYHMLPVLVLCSAVLLLCRPAAANLTLGANARSVAMGGAGLASGDAQGSTSNPAFLAGSTALFGVVWPTVDTHMTGGAGLGDAVSLLTSAKVDAGKALDLIEDFGKGATTLDASASAGLFLPRADLMATAAVHTEIMPNPEFSDWVRTGMTGELSPTAQADVYAGGVATLPSLGFGFYLPEMRSLPGETAVGIRVKPTQLYYSHYVFDSEDTGGRPAAEMGGNSYLKSTSFSADAGLLYTPKQHPNLKVALMVNNLIEPKAIKFNAPSERFGREKQLAPRSVGVGAAWVNENVTLAADLVDLGNTFGTSSLRLGGELRLPSGIALRGGYNSANGLTAGVGIGNLGLAYSKDEPVMVSTSVSF